MKRLRKVRVAVGVTALLTGVPLRTASGDWWGGPGSGNAR